jgi:Lon-like protease
VTRHDDAAAPKGGAALGALIRGNIVAHLLSMSEPDASADGDAAANPITSDAGPIGAGPLPPTPVVARRRKWPAVLGIALALLLAAALIAGRISVNYYVITPGDATPVAQYIEVPAVDSHPLTGKILLTDVFVTQLNALSWLQYTYFDSNSEVISGPELLGPSVSENQYLDQGYLQMTQAQSFATAAALSRLGYTVTSTNAGALIYGIAPGSPAASTLHVAQVITAVNSTPVTTDCSLIDALHGLTPGTKASLTVEESSINDVGQFESGPTATKSVTLGTPPKGLVDTGCGAPTKPTAYLGIQPQTQQEWQFPVKVTVHTQNIGGPSAGLSMTLGIMDKLSSGRLTGNRIVAATGTIDQNGNVGDVGGVAEKTIAVERAGATVFFVPSVEYKTAESKATPQLHVYGVNNLDQVLRILKSLGGKVPIKPVPVQAAP